MGKKSSEPIKWIYVSYIVAILLFVIDYLFLKFSLSIFYLRNFGYKDLFYVIIVRLYHILLWSFALISCTYTIRIWVQMKQLKYRLVSLDSIVIMLIFAFCYYMGYSFWKNKSDKSG